MTTGYDPGNGLCYLDHGRSVSAAADWSMADPLKPAPTDTPWRTWGRSLFALAVVVALAALGIANVALYSRWHEVEDGVLWGARGEGVTAVETLRQAQGDNARRPGQCCCIMRCMLPIIISCMLPYFL